MTNLDIDAIRQREQAATKGPWKATSNNCIEAPAGFRGRVVASVGAYESGWPSAPDAEFIAHAREDVPTLIAEVERLRAEVARRQAVVDAVGRFESTAKAEPVETPEESAAAVDLNLRAAGRDGLREPR